MNLLEETIKKLAEIDKMPFEIMFIGSLDSGHSCTWHQFKLLANKEYDSGFGAQEVASDLVIVFSDYTFIYRSEYDGSESWQYVSTPKIPEGLKEISSLFVSPSNVGWQTLEEINKDY